MLKNNIILKIDDTIVDIDNDTAIGSTRSGFNFSSPNENKLSYTNSFSIPITNKNDKILGFGSIVNNYTLNNTGDIYNFHNGEIYIDGILVLKGKCYVNNIQSNRININIVDARDIYDTFKNLDFITDSNSIVTVTSIIANELNTILTDANKNSFTDVITYCVNGENEVWIPYASGTLFSEFPYEYIDENNISSLESKSDDELENYNNMVTEYITGNNIVGNYKTGHFYVNAKFLLETIYASYNITLNIPDSLPNDYLRLPDLCLYYDAIDDNYRFVANNTYRRSVGNDGTDLMTKNFLDFVKMYMQEYCIVCDIEYTQGNYVHNWNTFASISATNKIDLHSTSKANNIEYKFDIPKKSWICYSGLGNDEDASTIGGRTIYTFNESAKDSDDNTVLFTIDRYLASYMMFYDNDNTQYTNLLATDNVDTCKEFILVQKGCQSIFTTTIKRYNSMNSSVSVSVVLYNAVQSTVGTTNYYDKYQSIVYSPVVMNIEVKMNPYILNSIKQYSIVSFDTVPGNWYITEINNYNPRTDSTINVKAVLVR